MTTSELFNGEDSGSDKKAMIEMLEKIQNLENQKNIMFGILLIILGIACLCLSQLFSGSNFKEFISGVLLGLSVGEMLVGIFITASSITKQ